MKIVRLSFSRTDRERRDTFGFEMDNSVLILHSTLNPNKSLVQHGHGIGAVYVWHNDDIGVASLVFQG